MPINYPDTLETFERRSDVYQVHLLHDSGRFFFDARLAQAQAQRGEQAETISREEAQRRAERQQAGQDPHAEPAQSKQGGKKSKKQKQEAADAE
jgi:hypothetical protein